MAKKTPKASEPAAKETKASPRAKAPAKSSEPAAKASTARAKVKVKAKAAEATEPTPKAKKAPTRATEPMTDSQLIIHGLAEVVRLGLSAMDPQARATLLAALVKVGSSLKPR